MSLHVTEHRDLYVPRELVFDAWTEAQHLSGWYTAADDALREVTLEGVAGGRIDVRWTDPSGASLAETGEFEDAQRPQGFRCHLELDGPGEASCATTLTVRLVDLGGACRIELDHSGFPTPAWRSRYAALWAERLGRLESYFSAI